MWIISLHMLRVDLERAKKLEIKLPTSVGSSKMEENATKTCTPIWLCQSHFYTDHNKTFKILQNMGLLEYFTCLLRNLYSGQEVTVRKGNGTNLFQVGNGVFQGCTIKLFIELTWRVHHTMLHWMKQGLESRLLGEISVTSDMQMTRFMWENMGSTTELLEESKRWEWLRLLETQHSKWDSWHPVPSLHGIKMGKKWKQWETLLVVGGAPKSLKMVTLFMKFKYGFCLDEKL